MAKKILIFGSEGMLGREFVGYFSMFPKYKIISVDRKEVDIASYNSVFKVIKKYKPDFIINSAALINVEYCEENPLEAYKVNSIGPGNIALVLKEEKLPNILFIQISTSDIFGGEKKFFKENDKPDPANVYGWSKFFGEKILEHELKDSIIKYFIVRTSWLYSKYRKTFVDFIYENLLQKRQIDVVSDQYGVVTWAKDLAKSIGELVKNYNKYESGIYHLISNFDRRLSRLDIAKKIAIITGAKNKYLKLSKRENVFKVHRSKNVALINSKLPKMPDWKKSLERYFLNT